MRILISFSICLFISLQVVSAQKSIHNYAYVVIPEQLTYQKEPGQYQLNELFKFLFEKEGMTVFFDNEKIPNDLRMLDCGALRLKSKKQSTMLTVKTKFTLSNCTNEIVFESQLGTSREKEFIKAYQESVRNSFKSFSELEYNYVALAPTSAAVVASEPILRDETQLNSEKLTYTNDEKLSLVLTVTEKGFLGKVISSPTSDYSSGELLCKLWSTSIPNVYKVQWKDVNGDFKNTIGYFDDLGNLKIDFTTEKGIEVITFYK